MTVKKLFKMVILVICILENLIEVAEHEVKLWKIYKYLLSLSEY